MLLFHVLVFTGITTYSIVWAGKIISQEEMQKLEVISIDVHAFAILILLSEALYIHHKIINEKQAKAFVEEMYFQGIPQKCTNVEITDESIKATFGYTTSVRDYGIATSNSFASNNVESIFFKQIQNITLNTGQTNSTRGRYIVVIATRTNNYLFHCQSQALANNFIDALEYYRRKALS